MKKNEVFVLLAILLTSALLGVSLLTRGHLWWDDFASYIMQAQSLMSGTAQDFITHNAFTISNSSYPPGPVAYPWGFPVLLIPVLAIFGMKILAIKAINTIFFLLFLVAFQRLARIRLTPGWSLFLTAILAFNPALLQGQDLILSDIPFLFFSTLALLLIEAGNKKAWLTGLIIFAAFTLRTNGLLLLVPLAAAQWMQFQTWTAVRKNWLGIAWPYFVFGILVGLQALLLPGGQESYLSHFSMFTTERWLANASYYLRLPLDLFQDIPFGVIFFWVMLILFFVGASINFRKNFPALSYLVVSLALFITWPETQGLRFIYPLVPLGLLMAAEGWMFAEKKFSGAVAPVARWTGLGAAGALIVLSLMVSAQKGIVNLQNGRDINGPFDVYSTEMFGFIREQTPPDSVIVFFRPRVMRLLTGRDSFLSTECARIQPDNFLVLSRKADDGLQIPADQVQGCGLSLKSVFENRRFIVYQVEK